MRNFQFSRRPNFKKKARWPIITRHMEPFCKPPTLSINHQGFLLLLTRDTLIFTSLLPKQGNLLTLLLTESTLMATAGQFATPTISLNHQGSPMKYGPPKKLTLLLWNITTTTAASGCHLSGSSIFFSKWHFIVKKKVPRGTQKKRKNFVIASQMGKDGTIRTKRDTLFFIICYYLFLYICICFHGLYFTTFVLWDS